MPIQSIKFAQTRNNTDVRAALAGCPCAMYHSTYDCRNLQQPFFFSVHRTQRLIPSTTTQHSTLCTELHWSHWIAFGSV